MDILSFVLGMSIVVVIALAVVAVLAFVRVNRINKEIENLHLQMSTEISQVNRNIEDEVRAIYSTLDSRLDRLHNSIIKK